MSSYRIVKRGVLFGVDGDNLTPEDFAQAEEGSVQQSGQPVAVLFGTRTLDPVVVAWGSAGSRIVNYYDPLNTSTAPSAISDTNRTLRMVNLTMRMALCVGKIDGFSAWTAGGITFRASQQPLPSGAPTNYVDAVRDGVLRFIIAVGDIDLFGGGEAGGLGSTLGRDSYSSYTQYSQFFYSSLGELADNRLDALVEYRGLSSLYFKLFNFGGNLPPPIWKVTATRIDTLTTRDDNTNAYKDQWLPSLATIQTLPFRRTGIYYLIALSRSLTATQRVAVGNYFRALSYDDKTTYQFILMGRPTAAADLPASSTSAVFTSRADALAWFANYQSAAPDTWATNFTTGQAETIVVTYADRMISNYSNDRHEVGVIVCFLSDVFGLPLGLTASNPRTPTSIQGNITTARIMLGLFNYPRFAPGLLSSSTFTESRLDAVGKNPPDFRLALFSYYNRNTNTYAANPYSYTTFPLTSTAETAFEELDAYHAPIIIGGTGDAMPTDEFVKQFRTVLPVGRSMNPVHALRELLTNKTWGKGIEEALIDDNAFTIAAQACYDEKLDFCYLHKAPSPNPVVKQIGDYIDGITYYNPALNKVTIKLIRNDFNIADLQSFDESSIGKVSNFKRQQANRLVNGVSIKYHDVSLGTDETVSIHDLESTSEQQGAKTANLSLPGCATREAAARVAARELSALSKSVVSCTVNINPTRPLGLGDPIVISYRDLGLAQLVMRVAKIDYGTGLTGGINVDLIQDVFSAPYYTDLVGDVTIPDSTEALADLPDVIKFLELSAYDLRQANVATPFATNPDARYFKFGLKDDPLLTSGTRVSYDGSVIPVSIGSLLTPIFSLTASPIGSSPQIDVNLPRGATSLGTAIRIDDEVIGIGSATRLDDTTVRIIANGRALRDTVAVPHAVGADVWLLDSLSVNNTPWDGTPIVVSQTKDGLVDSDSLTPSINFIARGRLPLPPRWVSVDGKFISDLIIDGDIAVMFQGRPEATSTNLTVVRLTKGDTELYRQATSLPTLQSGAYATQTQTITGTNLTTRLGAGIHDLVLTVSGLAVDGNTASWQSWLFRINWSSTTREREGWSYNHGNNWGSGRAVTTIDGQPVFTGQGWDFQWDDSYDD